MNNVSLASTDSGKQLADSGEKLDNTDQKAQCFALELDCPPRQISGEPIGVLKESNCQTRKRTAINSKQLKHQHINNSETLQLSSRMEETNIHEEETEVLEENHLQEHLVAEELSQNDVKEEDTDKQQLIDELNDEGNNNDEDNKQDLGNGESVDKKEDEDEEEEEELVNVKQEDGKEMKTRRRDGQPADLDICRVCTSKENLGDIFEFESAVRICDLIMKLCTTVRITERDHLPHKICKSCVEKVRIAHEFKTTCENTDKELRKTLKRSYNKSRRTTDFVIVNCPMSDEEENDEEPQDDDEYKVSQSEVESEPVTSDDSFEPPNKKKKTPKRRGRRPRSLSSSLTSPVSGKRRRGRQPGSTIKKQITTPSPGSLETPRRRPGRPPKSAKTPGIANVVYIEAPEASSSDSEDDKPIRPRKVHDCTKCDETFNTGVELKEHLQTHKGDLFPCTKCEKTFKSKVYLSNHLERHEQDDKKREEKIKAKELKRQQQKQKELMKRKELEERLKRQKQDKSSANSSAEKKKKAEPSPANSGRDLFKCVAPLTSTYWSDSFSD